jgi:Lecithin retinol acyltransferase
MNNNLLKTDAGPEPWSSAALEQEPTLGAHLTTKRHGYSHHGIYVGNGRVVHYAGLSGGLWQCGPVEEVSLHRFGSGTAIQLADPIATAFSSEEIVRRARSRLGENDYRLLTNNCEHFCNWCVSGVSHSAQVQQPLRLPLRALVALFHT